MIMRRLIYTGILVFSAALLFFFGSGYMLALIALELLIPFLSMLLLRIDAGSLRLTLSARSACVKGQSNSISVSLHSRRRLLAAGMLDITFEYHNKLLDTTRLQRVKIPVSGQGRTFSIPFTPVLCGEITIKCISVSCLDLLQLCSAPVEKCSTQHIMVYPDKIPMDIHIYDSYSTSVFGEQLNRDKKGSDAQEVFDLRDYAPGDDVRSIHWKLSGRLGKTIVKEASDTSHYDTMLLIDVSRSGDGSRKELEPISASVGLATVISEKLLEIGASHCVAAPVNDRIELFSISNRAEYNEMLASCISMTLPNRKQIGLQHFAAGNYKNEYTKIIYVTAESFPDKMTDMLSPVDVTAICVCPPGGSVQTGQDKSCRMLEIPSDKLYDSTHTIYL